MQTAPRLWTGDALGHAPHPVRLHVRPGTLGGTMKRCQRCDIPLGSRPCPNPLCPEQHGQSAGDLCVWCFGNHEERRAMMDIPSCDEQTEAAHHGVYQT